MALIPGLELGSFGFGGVIGQLFFWIGWGLVGLILVAAMFAIYYFMSFPYKISYWPLYGSGKDGQFAFDKPKKNRARFNKERTAWILMWPLFKSTKVNPFDSEFIYPGKNCLAFELNGTYIPGRINVDKTEEEIRGEVNPVPTYIRNWQSLKQKENALEFSEKSWWDENKAFVYTLITAGLCLAMVGLTVWLTYKYAGPKSADMARLADALHNFATIRGG